MGIHGHLYYKIKHIIPINFPCARRRKETLATVGTQELNINLCIFFAPMEQKSEKIIRKIFGAWQLRNISGSKSLRLQKRF